MPMRTPRTGRPKPRPTRRAKACGMRARSRHRSRSSRHAQNSAPWRTSWASRFGPDQVGAIRDMSSSPLVAGTGVIKTSWPAHSARPAEAERFPDLRSPGEGSGCQHRRGNQSRRGRHHRGSWASWAGFGGPARVGYNLAKWAGDKYGSTIANNAGESSDPGDVPVPLQDQLMLP